MELTGIPVSPGIEIGKALIYNDLEHIAVHKTPVPASRVEAEVERFRAAVARTAEEISGVYNKLAEDLEEEQARILQAQVVFMEDRFLIDKTIERIRKESICAPYVFFKLIEETINVLSNLDNPYLKTRAEDIRYIGRAILGNLLGKKERRVEAIKDKVIIVAHDLSPADTAMMDKDKVISFVADVGSRTSHTAIMARSLEIPAVVGLENISELVSDGDILAVDGISGKVIINPSREQAEEYKLKKQFYIRTEKELAVLSRLSPQTIDGHHVSLTANIEMSSEASSVLSHGADGIGLYRTEFLYLNRKNLPDEEEQYRTYLEVISKVSPQKVVIRTIDLGGDKFFSHIEMSKEINPFMGCRGIRFCLEQPDIFRTQLKAILRAGAGGNAAIMFPLVSCLEEFREAKRHLEETKKELKRKGVPFDEDIQAGVMIETPSSAMIADILAGEADFFSIGTNDLIQYTMAIDRVNEKVAHLYRPAHPGILRIVKKIVDAGHENGIRVDMCGEMAGEFWLIVLLIGMGIDGLSMSPVAIPAAKKTIRAITLDFAREVAERVLSLSTSSEVEAELKKLCAPYLGNARE